MDSSAIATPRGGPEENGKGTDTSGLFRSTGGRFFTAVKIPRWLYPGGNRDPGNTDFSGHRVAPSEEESGTCMGRGCSVSTVRVGRGGRGAHECE